MFSSRTSAEAVVDFCGGHSSETLVLFPVLTLEELLAKFLYKNHSQKIPGKIITENAGEVSEGNCGQIP